MQDCVQAICAFGARRAARQEAYCADRNASRETRETVENHSPKTAASGTASIVVVLGVKLNSFASGECFAQRRLPARAELLGDFGIRHEEVESVKGATHDQEFGCDSGVDEPARVLHVFFDEQVNGTDADPGRR